jgi:outer membrane protein TolC
MGLKECYDYAMEHSYTVKNAQLDVLIQEAQNSQTLSAAYPHISAKGEFDDFVKPQASFVNGRMFGGPDAIVPIAFSLPYASSVGLSASQILFDGSVMVALEARRSVLELAKQNGVVTKQSLKYNIFKVYYSIVVLQKQYDILKQSISYVRVMQQDITAMHNEGVAEKIDVERMTVTVNNMMNDSMRIANVVTIQEQMLKYILGMDIKAPLKIVPSDLEDHARQASSLLLEQENYTRVPEYNLAQTGLTLNQLNLKRYKMSAYPSIAAFASAGNNYGTDKFADLYKLKHWESNFVAGLQISLPIFNGFIRKYQIKETNLNIEKSKNNIESLKQGLDFTAEQARTNMRNSLIQLASQKKNIELANDVLDLAQRKYKEGVGSNLEVVTAQGDQLKAQNNYISTLQDFVSAEADLRKALGLLDQ